MSVIYNTSGVYTLIVVNSKTWNNWATHRELFSKGGDSTTEVKPVSVCILNQSYKEIYKLIAERKSNPPKICNIDSIVVDYISVFLPVN